MCKFSTELFENPKEVGDKLVAGIYARYDNGIPVKTNVYLLGYNSNTKQHRTFGTSIPRQSDAWCGIPMITLTPAMAGSWVMSWATDDEYGEACLYSSHISLFNISEKIQEIYLTSDRTSIQSGDSVKFWGYYSPGKSVIIEDKTDFLPVFIGSTTCTANGDFSLIKNLFLPVGSRKIQASGSGIILPTTTTMYITVAPTIIPPTSTYECNTPLDGWETDQYGNTRKATRCNPLTPSKWVCIEPKNGRAKDQYGNVKEMAGCEAGAGESVWECSSPKDGYAYDQYNNKKVSTGCNPTKGFDYEEILNKYGLYIGIGIIGLIIMILLIMRK